MINESRAVQQRFESLNGSVVLGTEHWRGRSSAHLLHCQVSQYGSSQWLKIAYLETPGKREVHSAGKTTSARHSEDEGKE